MFQPRVHGLAVIVLLFGFAHWAEAYTAFTVSVDSNLLTFDGKLLFVQGTGSMTLLEVASGEVLLRKVLPPGFTSGVNLQRTRHGIVLMGYQEAALLNERTLDEVWVIQGPYDLKVSGDYLIGHDGDSTVKCYDIASGKLRWEDAMKGCWHIVSRGDRAMVATPDYYDGGQALRVYDLPSGQVLLHKKAEEGECWVETYFDGESVYIAQAAGEKPLLTDGQIPQTLEQISLQGETIRHWSFDSADITNRWPAASDFPEFFIKGKVFTSDGSVREAYSYEPSRWLAEINAEASLPHALPDGVLTEATINDKDGEAATVVKFIDEQPRWQACLGHDGMVYRVEQAEGKLIVETERGCIECFDLKTGQPKWIYTFPVIRRTASYSSDAMPPMLTQQAVAYRRGLKKLGQVTGSRLIPSDENSDEVSWRNLRDSHPYSGNIIVDPRPDDPYAFADQLVRRALAFVIFPIVGLAACIVYLRRRNRRLGRSLSRRDNQIIAGLAGFMLILTMTGLLLYGRVDHWVTQGMLAMVVACLGLFVTAGYKAAKTLKRLL